MNRLTNVTYWVIPLLLTFSFKPANAQNRSKLSDSEIASKVDSLMQKMSLTDKVGEMTQLTIDMVADGSTNSIDEPQKLDPAKLHNILVNYRVGSILNVSGHAYSLQNWHNIIRQIEDVAINDKPTGIPVLYGIDTIHGDNYTLGATLFPQEIAQAATWNPALVKEGARIAAYETRASWIPWVFSPVLGLGRNPQWPRFWETLGEDPYLVKTLATALINGYQGDDPSDPHRVAACMKHFLGYSMPLTGQDRTQAWIPDRQLKEYFVPPFKAAVNAGVLTAMINSGDINGVPVHSSKKILTGLLRDDLGFKGLAVSDWQDIRYLFERYHIAKDYKDAIKIAINAGVDMSMVPLDLEFPKLLKELVQDGEVPMSRINESVRRILTVKYKIGLFDHPYYTDKNLYTKFRSKEFAQASYRTASEAVTLLKNQDHILPLSKNNKVLVTGPTANSLNYLNGGWTHTWQNDDPQYNTPGKQTILEAIQKKIGQNNVTYLKGTSIDSTINIDDVVEAAKKVRAAVICVGESTYTETPGNIKDMELPEAQQDLVNRVAATGTPVVLVMVEGRPRIVSKIVPKTKGVLMAYLPGDEGGPAIADILFGDKNPSGKLPFTYPRNADDLLQTYYHRFTDEVDPTPQIKAFNPQWEFGDGLSYTTFGYSNLQVDKTSFGQTDSVKITVDVKNTGDRTGKEVVQLYVRDMVASITPSVKRLRGFDKIDLKPGESKMVTFTISPKDLAFVNRENKWVTEAGDFKVMIGKLSEKITYNE